MAEITTQELADLLDSLARAALRLQTALHDVVEILQSVERVLGTKVVP